MSAHAATPSSPRRLPAAAIFLMAAVAASRRHITIAFDRRHPPRDDAFTRCRAIDAAVRFAARRSRHLQ